MNRLLIAVSSLLLLTSCSSQNKQAEPAPATIQVVDEQTSGSEPLGRRVAEIVEVEAIVTAIDHKTRLLTLRGADNRSVTLTVGEEVKRFNEIKVGDTVVAGYYAAVAYEVRPPTAEEIKNPLEVIAGGEKSAPGAAPAGAVMARVKAIVTIKAIDHAAGTVTIKGPKGNVTTIKSDRPENLKRVKVGDTAAVTYTEMMVISLEPSKTAQKHKH